MERLALEKDLVEKIVAMPVPEFPYRFVNGSVLQSIDFVCSYCGRSIPLDWLRGDFVAYNEMSASLEGYSLCEECELIMPIAVRVRDDGTMLVRCSGHGWQTIQYDQPQVGSVLMFRLKKLLFG